MATTTEPALTPAAMREAERAQEAARTKALWAQHERLSFPIGLRFLLFTSVAGIGGFGLGAVHGAQETGLRFRAENAHRLPTTQAGWFLYHKSKNYVSMLGGIKEGFRMAGRLALTTTVFVGMEEGIDRARSAAGRTFFGDDDRTLQEQNRSAAYKYGMESRNDGRYNDFLSTTFAGLGTAGLVSAWHRFPMVTSARMAWMGMKWGFVFGVAQDVVGLWRGRRLAYVDLVKRTVLGRAEQDEGGEVAAEVAG